MRQLVYEKENTELKPVKLRLKIDLVSYPAPAEVLVNRIKIIIFGQKLQHRMLTIEFLLTVEGHLGNLIENFN